MYSKKLFRMLALVLVAVLVFAACGPGGGGTPAAPAPAAPAAEAAAPAAEADDPADEDGGGGLMDVLDEDDVVDVFEGDGDITLRVTWLGTGGRDRVREGLQPFIEETGIGVDVIYVTGNWAEYFTKIQLMIAAGEVIDLVNVAIEGFEMLVHLGIAVPIDDWISRNQEAWHAVTDDISPAVMDIARFNGMQYGIPKEWNNVVTHINMAMLEEAGLDIPPPDWDRATFLQYAQAMTRTREDGTRQFGVAVPNYYFGFQGWLFNNDTTYMSEDFTESNLLDPRVAEMLQFMYDLIYVYEVAPIPEPGMATTHLFMQGDIGMHFAGRWPTFQYYYNDFFDVSIQYVPRFAGPHVNHMTWGGTAVFTTRASQHPDEATKLGLFLASQPFIDVFMTAGAIPVLNSVAERLVPALGVPHNNELFITSADIARPVQSPPQFAEVHSMMDRVFSDILVSRRDVATVLAEADAELNMILFDNR